MTEIEVVTLCGSTRFKKEFSETEGRLALAGKAVFSLAFFEKSDKITLTKEQERLFGEIHFKKIDLSDSIFVIDVDGYIGESTQEKSTMRQKIKSRLSIILKKSPVKSG